MLEQIKGSRNRASAPSRFSHSTILLILAAMATLLFLISTVFLGETGGQMRDVAVMATFILNGIVGVVFLCKGMACRPFSLVQMHWIFYITMFVIAPIAQYLNGYSAWGYSLTSSDYLVTNVVLTVWGALFAIFTQDRSQNATYNQKYFFNSLPVIGLRAEMIALIVSIAATALVIAVVGFSNLFARSTYSTGFDQTTELLFDKGVRLLPVFAFVIILARAKQCGKPSFGLYVAFILMLIACFPGGMARYSMACIYGAVLLLSLTSLFEKKGLFPVLFLLAFLVVFPASNVFRSENFSVYIFFESVFEAIENTSQGFCAVDYDAYSIVSRSLTYVSTWGSTGGYQLLGVLLFFVPRSFWPSKPEGSGNLICSAQGQSVLNISAPLPAEGIVNFGIVGLIIFAVAVALICRCIDRWFVRSNSLLRLFYPFICLLLFFIMRGDLLSSFAYSVGYAASFFILCLICLGPKVTCGFFVSSRSLSKKNVI